jgi:dTDP-4-dehydrorhamnose 3,5-epimerase
MNFIRTCISDVVVCEPKVFSDERGYFLESFNQEHLENFIGRKISFCQDNESKSSYGVLRGLHFQKPPHTQSKLVRVIAGSVLDVVVDLREYSETFGKSVCVELSSENKKQLFIPRGFAHGFIVLEDNTIFAYKVDNYYNKDSEGGLIYNDNKLKIDWLVETNQMVLSDKDKINPELMDVYKFKGELYD